MHIKTRNVNTAFAQIVAGMFNGSILTEVRPSRYGETITIPEPVLVTYERPRERVLFNTVRDANPFFHLYEALWMLAGRNDVEPLAYYCKRMREFSDDGETFNGAYGNRWRNNVVEFSREMTKEELEIYAPGQPAGTIEGSENIDQLKTIIQHLKNKPESRRAVLAMWNVEDDLMKIGGINQKGYMMKGIAQCEDKPIWDKGSKDVCCNLNVLFEVETGTCPSCEGGVEIGFENCDPAYCSRCHGKPHEVPRYLNMTVTNRSNDLVWGLLGANYVHFTFLQEYVAGHLGLEVGVYHHFTNNLHAYSDNWKPEEWLDVDKNSFRVYEYEKDVRTFLPLSDMKLFDLELEDFVERHQNGNQMVGNYGHSFFVNLAQPMCAAFHAYKRKDWDSALRWLHAIGAKDWRVAAINWIEKRRKKYVSK